MTDIPLGPVGPSMMCDVCGTRLNNFEQWAGNKLVKITWHHTGLMPEGFDPNHEPVPVLLDPNEIPRAGYCDFCNAESPEWTYPTAAFQMDVASKPTKEGTETLGWGSTDNWAACQDCRDDIEAGKWEGIERRYFSHKDVPKAYRTTMRQSVRVLHRQFRLHRLGPPFKNVKDASKHD